MNKQRKPTDNYEIRVVELFAGVGGFRLGLEKGTKKMHHKCRVVWSNQWEPATKRQHASEVYENHFGNIGHSNEDISTVSAASIPNHDLLVGGFPCQDYSVARTLKDSKGLGGEKGVLWWQIHRILEEKGRSKPKYLLLENVDRLLKSPAKQRGRDFAIMLTSLSDLGYAVEWRVINAADYGMPQRRRRIFIFAYKKGTPLYKKAQQGIKNPEKYIESEGLFPKAFPVAKDGIKNRSSFEITGDLADVTENFSKHSPNLSPFRNSGLIVSKNVFTQDVQPKYTGKRTLMKEVLQPEKVIPKEFYIPQNKLKEWKYLKGSKRESRTSSTGFVYEYTEGSMKFPEPLTSPSRTVVTGEGGSSPSRFKHVIKTESGKYRRLTPVELERLCMFPDNHTQGQTSTKRAFLMGNALVVGVIEKLGKQLSKEMDR